MKKFNLIRKTLVTLMAVVLSVTFTFSDYAVVNADTTTSTEVSSEKELVQCSNDWVIFKYTDENGEPTFDVKYQGKSNEELESEGNKLQYRILVENYNTALHIGRWTNIENRVQLEIPKNKCKVQFRLVSTDESNEISISDSFALERDDDLFAYILYASSDYYYNLTEKPNRFKLELKFNQHLKQVEDLSVLVTTSDFDIASNYLSNHPISNISFKNYSESYTVEEKTYTIDYSIISFDVDIIPTLDDYSDTSYPYAYWVNYTFSFNGLVGLYSNNPVEEFLLITETPAFPYDMISKPIPVQSVQVTSTSSNIKAGNSVSLTANILPGNATNKDLTWSSSNIAYATVDENGVVTTKAAGAGKTVTITAKSTDGSNVEDSFTLKILPIAVNSIKITAANSSVNAGNTIALKSTVNSNATNKSIVWSSSNKNYATVNSSGLVTTKKAGAGKTVTITAKAADGSGKLATFKLKIKKVAVKKLKLKVAKKSVKVGKKLKIKVSITPTTATNQKVKWTVSNKKYAKINSKGVLTAKKAGAGKTVKVTAKAKDGSGKKATIKIKIKKK